jgi:hypothetical protein
MLVAPAPTSRSEGRPSHMLWLARQVFCTSCEENQNLTPQSIASDHVATSYSFSFRLKYAYLHFLMYYSVHRCLGSKLSLISADTAMPCTGFVRTVRDIVGSANLTKAFHTVGYHVARPVHESQVRYRLDQQSLSNRQ